MLDVSSLGADPSKPRNLEKRKIFAKRKSFGKRLKALGKTEAKIMPRRKRPKAKTLEDLTSLEFPTDILEEDALSLFGTASSPQPTCSEISDSSEDEISRSPNKHARAASSMLECQQPWQPLEVDLFYEGLVRYHKDFTKVSRHVVTKSVRDCVEFYYLWKNICFEESQSFKSLFAQSLQCTIAGGSSISSDQHSTAAASVTSAASLVSPSVHQTACVSSAV